MCSAVDDLNAQMTNFSLDAIKIKRRWLWLLEKYADLDMGFEDLQSIVEQDTEMILSMQATIDNMTATNVNSVLDYIQDNGIMVSDRWFIGTENATGDDLIIRDEVSTAAGNDARYRFSTGVYENL